METFTEFTFEAAHTSPPFEGLHGHTLTARVVMRGEPDPVYGWSHNLYDVKKHIEEVRALVDHKYLNDIEGLARPTLENTTQWLYAQFKPRIHGLFSVTLTRGLTGTTEGCTISAPAAAAAHA